MTLRKLSVVLTEFHEKLDECRAFANDAQAWAIPGAVPRFSPRRRDVIVEHTFLGAFLAWETFLEESFVLYMLGAKAPKGRAPRRFAVPPNRKVANGLVAEGKEYGRWDGGSVHGRAKRFFGEGRPFVGALTLHQSMLEQAKTIRNAVAHETSNAWEKFEDVVRKQLGNLPQQLTVGSFLVTTVPQTTPPQSFLELYLDKMDAAADHIVPT